MSVKEHIEEIRKVTSVKERAVDEMARVILDLGLITWSEYEPITDWSVCLR